LLTLTAQDRIFSEAVESGDLIAPRQELVGESRVGRHGITPFSD